MAREVVQMRWRKRLPRQRLYCRQRQSCEKHKRSQALSLIPFVPGIPATRLRLLIGRLQRTEKEPILPTAASLNHNV
jgi:hypothetical protein